MGARVEIECPVEGCSYSATFRLAMGEETSGSTERVAILRDEHPSHPPAEHAGKSSEPPTN
jgi:hypothetical protein